MQSGGVHRASAGCVSPRAVSSTPNHSCNPPAANPPPSAASMSVQPVAMRSAAGSSQPSEISQRCSMARIRSVSSRRLTCRVVLMATAPHVWYMLGYRRGRIKGHWQGSGRLLQARELWRIELSRFVKADRPRLSAASGSRESAPAEDADTTIAAPDRPVGLRLGQIGMASGTANACRYQVGATSARWMTGDFP